MKTISDRTVIGSAAVGGMFAILISREMPVPFSETEMATMAAGLGAIIAFVKEIVQSFIGINNEPN